MLNCSVIVNALFITGTPFAFSPKYTPHFALNNLSIATNWHHRLWGSLKAQLIIYIYNINNYQSLEIKHCPAECNKYGA